MDGNLFFADKNTDNLQVSSFIVYEQDSAVCDLNEVWVGDDGVPQVRQLSQQTAPESKVERQTVPEFNVELETSSESNEEPQTPPETIVETQIESNVERVNCHLCNKSFASKKSRYKHWRMVHKVYAPKKEYNTDFTCDVCNKSFASKSSLHFHIRYVHNPDNKPAFKCDYCSYQSLARSQLKKHIKRHLAPNLKKEINETNAGGDSWSCDVCPKTFKSKTALSSHTNGVHFPKKYFECDLCSYKISRKSNFKRHIITNHLAPKRERKFVCSVCGLRYVDKMSCKKHEKRVHGINNYEKKVHEKKCPKCSFVSLKYPRKEIHDHFTEAHNILITSETRLFDEWDSFLEWKNEIEKSTFAYYRGDKEAKPQHFTCNRSGMATGKNSCKINAFCPSEFHVRRLENGVFEVEYCPVHVGHTNQKYMFDYYRMKYSMKMNFSHYNSKAIGNALNVSDEKGDEINPNSTNDEMVDNSLNFSNKTEVENVLNDETHVGNTLDNEIFVENTLNNEMIVGNTSNNIKVFENTLNNEVVVENTSNNETESHQVLSKSDEALNANHLPAIFKRERKFACSLCGLRYIDKITCKKHERKAHGINNYEKKVHEKKCPKCSFVSLKYPRKEIHNHFTEAHNISITCETHVFDNWDLLLKWKNEIEKSTFAYYRGEKEAKPQYFTCNRSGVATGPNSYKINAFCPSEMHVKRLENGSFEVEYWPVHVGHMNNKYDLEDRMKCSMNLAFLQSDKSNGNTLNVSNGKVDEISTNDEMADNTPNLSYKTMVENVLNDDTHVENTSNTNHLPAMFKRERKFACSVCGLRYVDKMSCKKHERKFHGVYNYEKKLHEKRCPTCSFVSLKYPRKEIHDHFTEAHNIPITSETHVFDNWDLLLKWKNEIEKSTFSYYKGEKEAKPQYFTCNRSGMATGPNSYKINAFCPSEMHVKRLENGGFEVEYWPVHVGHMTKKYVLEDSRMKYVMNIQRDKAIGNTLDVSNGKVDEINSNNEIVDNTLNLSYKTVVENVLNDETLVENALDNEIFVVNTLNNKTVVENFLNNVLVVETTSNNEAIVTQVLSNSIEAGVNDKIDENNSSMFELQVNAEENKPPEKKFSCNSCEKSFSKENYLKIHINTMHLSTNAENNLPRKKCSHHMCENLLDNCIHLDNTRDKPPEKKFSCDLCEKSFSKENYLKIHMDTMHLFKDVFSCFPCQFETTDRENYVKHMVHQHKAGKDRPFKCSACRFACSNTENLKNHERNAHGISNLKNKRYNKQCPMCSFVSSMCNRKGIHAHFEEAHNIKISSESYTFKDLKSFKEWKTSMEQSTNSRFSNLRHSVQRKKYLSCVRSGSYKGALSNIQGGKINAFCPAEILLIPLEDGGFKVDYWPIHVGHTQEMFHLQCANCEEKFCSVADLKKHDRGFHSSINFPKEVCSRRKVYKKHEHLSQRSNTTKEMCSTDETVDENTLNIDNEIVILDDVTKDILNLNNEHSYHTLVRQISDKSWVADLKTDKYTSMCHFKPQGVINYDFPDLKEDDYLLIFMSNSQNAMMKAHGNSIICIDSAQGLNDDYNLNLYTILVIDASGNAYPAAFMLTNRRDEFVVCTFYKKINEHCGGYLMPSVFISDIEEIAYSAWCKTMGHAKVQIYSTWHVLKDWETNLNRIGNETKKERVLIVLKSLLHEVEKDTFHSLLDAIVENSTDDPETEQFFKYFLNRFIDGTRYKQWAHCYLIENGINVDISFENFDKVLKQCYQEATKTPQTLDEILCAVFNPIKNALYDWSNVMDVDRTLLKSSQRHMKSLLISKDSFRKINNSTWEVSSSTGMEDYVVRKVENCSGCQLLCTHCKSCWHEFVCTCMDSAVRKNMCIHIHAVALSVKDKDCDGSLVEEGNTHQGSITFSESESSSDERGEEMIIHHESDQSDNEEIFDEIDQETLLRPSSKENIQNISIEDASEEVEKEVIIHYGNEDSDNEEVPDQVYFEEQQEKLQRLRFQNNIDKFMKYCERSVNSKEKIKYIESMMKEVMSTADFMGSTSD